MTSWQASNNQGNSQGLVASYVAQQSTMSLPAMLSVAQEPLRSEAQILGEQEALAEGEEEEKPQKPNKMRFVAAGLAIALAVAIYLIWRTPSQPATTAIASQNFTVHPVANNTAGPSSGFIQVYVVGAVKHPGLYTLKIKARVNDLLEAAGGTLPGADLVALNLAATLSDGQEVYVTLTGERPPAYIGGVPADPGAGGDGGTGSQNNQNIQKVNINTASTSDLRQQLSVSSTTASAIVNYRLQHGPYTSVEQLLQVISKAIYTRIKDQVSL